MKNNWSVSNIGEACQVVNGGTPKTGEASYWGGPHQWITPAEMGKLPSPYVDSTKRSLTDHALENSSANLIPPHSVILSTRAPIGYLVINTVPMATNQGCRGIIPGEKIHHKFLFYYLYSITDTLNELGTGATFKEISNSNLKKIPLPVPPLPDQQRIVAKLDEAFAAIAKAKENAEKNIANARAIFESYLESVFTQRGEGWIEQKLGDICKMKTGRKDVNEGNPDGKYPFFTCAAAHTFSDNYSFDTEALLVAGNGNVGQVSYYLGKFEAYQRTYVLFDFQGVTAKYIFRVLDGRLSMAVSKQKLGNTMPYIKIGMLKNFVVPIPPPKEQALVAERLSSIAEDAQHLAHLYKQKLVALEALTQSLLHQTFSAEL